MKFGIVTERDAATCKCRVKFLADNIVSMPLPVLVAATKSNKHYHLPDIGEQVVCLMDENLETGVIVGAIYSQVDEVPTANGGDVESVTFSDGAEFKYDRANNQLDISGVRYINITADGDIVITCDTAHIDAANGVDITGNVEVAGTITATGNIVTTADVKAGAGGLITLLTHKHPTAATGAPSTPIP